MIVKILGIQPVDFTSSDGSQIQGTNLYCAFEDESVNGLKTDKFFVRKDTLIPKVDFNSSYNVEFNYKGKIQKITESK